MTSEERNYIEAKAFHYTLGALRYYLRNNEGITHERLSWIFEDICREGQVDAEKALKRGAP